MDVINVVIDAIAHSTIIHSLIEKLRSNYVFPDIAEQISTVLLTRLDNKEYAHLTDGERFAQTLTDHIQEFNQDKHLHVYCHPEPLPDHEGPMHEDPECFEEWQQQAKLDNYGLHTVERLPGNVGYLDIRAFHHPLWGGDTAIAALNFLAHANVLIIDLRQCGGGHPGMVAVISSYFFGPEPVHLNSLYWRAKEIPQQFWTLPYVPGKRFGDKPLYVLTSKNTFSGGEEFAYNLKTLQRATLVGEVTGGGAHPGRGYRLHPHFEVFIPSGRPINPITRTNWEGTGVIPDVPTDQTQSFNVAYGLALKSIIDSIGEMTSRPFSFLKEEAQTALKELETAHLTPYSAKQS